ncbi:MAG: L-threonylcarbamoyladenylate synthase [Candidatus Marsarchaeota archaeon]|nr:L-threonylcarbamoyladenylate synthase [Candidatus Marsarchaeota archaeon]
MQTIIMRLGGSSGHTDAVRAAARIMREGGVAVFPTETVYGIGTNALDGKACARVYRIKGRERKKALIVLVSDMQMLGRIAYVPRGYRRALSRAWPAPLTVILRSKPCVPSIVTAGTGTVAVRIPSNTIALALIRAAGVPLIAPSANPSGLKPSETGAQAIRYFKGRVDAILDSGRAGCGVPSTIIALPELRVIREGAFTMRQIERAFGRLRA